MVHPTPTKVLFATTLQPLVGQLSGALAHGARLIAQCIHQEPTPQKMADSPGFRPTVCLDVTSVVVCTCGYDDGRIWPTRCAVIDAALDGR